VLFGKRVTFTNSVNTICRYLRIRLGATNNSGKDASGIANGNNMIFDHCSFTWGMDEVFSITGIARTLHPITSPFKILLSARHCIARTTPAAD
jgi:hypothetical protein